MSKDDPLQQQHSTPATTLWLDREHMQKARDNFWQQYQMSQSAWSSADKQTWDIAWAAAVAAFSFLQEGRLGPKS